MTTPTRELLIMLSSHMAYMQGQLEAFTQQSDPEDYYWYRESVALRQKVIDALAEGQETGCARDGGRTMTTDFRALCAELLQALTTTNPSAFGQFAELEDRARAALAAPEGVTDEELLSIDQLRDTWNAQADATNSWDELGIDEIAWWAQRQALARWGRPAPVPCDKSSTPGDQ